MSIIKLRGLVLREANSKDIDKIITVLTKEKGKKTMSAKGARRPKSSLIAGTQQFAYCDFYIYDGNIANINQIELIESFHNIRNDIIKLSYATYFMELIENTVLEGESSEELLKFTLKALQILNKTEYDQKLLSKIYELKLMQLIGYMPETTMCVNCGNSIEDNIYFSAEVCGILCSKCKELNNNIIKISHGSLSAIQYILSADLSNIFNFSVSEQVLNELSKITKAYISIHIEHKFKSLDFLKKLTNLN